MLGYGSRKRRVMPTKTVVVATRFSSIGKELGIATISVRKLADTNYVWIDVEQNGQHKNYKITVAQWQELNDEIQKIESDEDEVEDEDKIS